MKEISEARKIKIVTFSVIEGICEGKPIRTEPLLTIKSDSQIFITISNEKYKVISWHKSEKNV